jgi:glycolate oxidase FAD binding subunit
VAGADAIVAVGARTQWEVGGALARDCVEVRAPAGVLTYEPDDLTITVGAGTTFASVDYALRAHGQECPLDPRDPAATIGGLLAAGCSGPRRLRLGPLRDHVLEIRFVTADGRLVKGGGPTVKNVTGYDLVRLFVGSLGTLGVLTQATLRCRPRPARQAWFAVDEAEAGELFRASSLLWDGTRIAAFLEGAASDVAAQSCDLDPCAAPDLPDGAHRGRMSVAPGRVRALGAALQRVDGLRWCAELGVGTVHVAADDVAAFAHARAAAQEHGGWMLRERGGAPSDDGFGLPLPNLGVMRRVKAAFDPTGKLAPGRLPL